jgi:hypothetical protein
MPALSPESSGERLSRLQVVFLLAAVVACRLVAVRACPTYDDAFITFRYASNLAAGHGLVFNPGAAWEPVLGTTTVLYSLVMAAFARLGFDLVAASLAFNVLCDVGTALLLVRILGARPFVASVAILGFAALPQIARISVGGMESPLFALCAVGACAAAQARSPRAAGILAAATCLVRPEGVLLAAVLAVAQIRSPRVLGRFVAPLLLVGAVAMLLLVIEYGSAIPQSVLAKSAMQGKDPAAEKMARFWTAARQSFLPALAYAPLLPFVAWGLVRVLKQGGAARSLSLFSLAISGAYLVARPHTWGWYYYVPHLAWVVWLASGLEGAWTRFVQRFAPALDRAFRRLGPQVASVACAGAAAFAASRAATPIPSRVYEPLWEWARRTSAAEPDARILASDIGAIGYAWRGTVLDSEGLTWPDALVLRYPLTIIEAWKPEYLMVVAERPRLRHFAERPEVMQQYEPIARFNATGRTQLVLAPEDVPIEWSQDYLVFRRR